MIPVFADSGCTITGDCRESSAKFEMSAVKRSKAGKDNKSEGESSKTANNSK